MTEDKKKQLRNVHLNKLLTSNVVYPAQPSLKKGHTIDKKTRLTAF